jgi:hypothetical protein
VLSHEDMWGEWMYRFPFSRPRYKLKVSGQVRTPAVLPLGKVSAVPLDSGLGGPWNQAKRHKEDKILDPTGTQTLTPWQLSL